MQLFYIELPKLPNDKTELDQDLKQWVMYMNANNQQERQKVAANNPFINQAQHLLEQMALNPEDRVLYEDRLKGLINYYSGLGAAKEEGIQIGEQRGMQIGERLRAELIAKNMLKQNMSMSTIAELTGLSIDEIKQLKNN